MKKIIALALALVMVLSLCACGKKAGNEISDDPNLNKTENAFLNGFRREVQEKDFDLMKAAEKLADKNVSGYDCGFIEVEEGWLNGFSEEISGFKTGVMIAPWIGSVPLVCYIFESDSPEALQAKLNETADPRWNICTEAGAPVSEISGSYVFFLMAPQD